MADKWNNISDKDIQDIDDVTLGDYYNQKQALLFARAIENKCKELNYNKRRSSEQNRRLHKLFTEMANNLKGRDGLQHPAQWWKAMAVAEWLGFDEFVKPDKTVIYSLKHTSNCTIDELNQFMNEVERYAALRGVYLQDD